MGVYPFCSDLAAAQPAESDEATEHLATTTTESLVRMRRVGWKKQRQDSLVLDGS